METKRETQKIDNELALDMLSNTDHQKAVATINWLNNCRSKKEFNLVLKEALLPLMTSDSVFYGRQLEKQETLELLGSIDTPNNCQHNWENLISSTKKYSAITKSYSKSPDTTLRIFFDRKDLYNHNPSQSQDYSYPSKLQAHRCCTILTLQNEKNPSYQFHFCRQLNDKKKTFNRHDINLLNVLKSPLLQTLKLILFHEERPYSRKIMDFWSEQAEPMAVINGNGNIFFKSPAFEQITRQQEQSFMSTTLTLANTSQRRQVEGRSFLSKLGKRLYETKLTLICNNTNHKQSVYLIQLFRVSNATGKIFNQLNRKDLTHREIEIALMIYQGVATREIAETIHLSYHTVRNHIKNIYNKLEVSSRGEMLSWADK